MQPHISGIRNIGNESSRKRYRVHAVPFGSQYTGPSKSSVTVHGTPVDLRGDHQTVALSDTDGRYYIIGEYKVIYTL